MFGDKLCRVRQAAPLIHCITNYVTANDCANLLLACGASPVMADDPDEVEEFTALAQGLVLNLGTLDRRTVPGMLAAGRRAKALGHPVVLDPVGAGASRLRTATAQQLLEEVRPDILRGNFSEIKTLALGGGGTHGVDAAPADRVTEQTLAQSVAFVRDFARACGAIVAVTGAIDLVSDGQVTYCIRNGTPYLRRVTGTGCQLSALTAAFAAANPGQLLESTAAAVCAMGLCGQLAETRMGSQDGNASFRAYVLDAVCNLTADQLEQGADYEMR